MGPSDQELVPHAAPPRRRFLAVAIVGASVALHVGLLALSAATAPPEPPAPRTAEVVPFSAVRDESGAVTGARNEGGRRTARIRPDPAVVAR